MEKQKLKDIIQLFEESSITKMELEEGNLKIKLEKQGTGNIAMMDSVSSQINTEVKDDVQVELKEVVGEWIKAPLVGTYYQSNSSEAAPFVRVGDTVKKGDLLCIIEAMKVMNEIHATVAGTILEIAVEDGVMVEYHTPMILIGDSHV